MKKIFLLTLKVILIMVTLVTASISKAGTVKAVQLNEEYLYEKGSYANMLMHNGIEVLTTYVVYNKDGVEYPAYCIDIGKPGVGENGSYAVDTSNQISDVGLWKIVRNGYPYITVSQLGCANKEEAYTATKHAIYCYLASRSVDEYEPIGEAGIRVKNAMNKIIKLADSTEKRSTEFEVYSNQDKFEKDSKDPKYMSKTFYMRAYYSLFDVKLSLEGDYPEGTKIVNYQNEEITEFTGGISFKVIYPIQNAKQSGSFGLRGVATMNTCPIIYGRAYDSSLQDYALTGDWLGDSECYISLNYKENNTQITIEIMSQLYHFLTKDKSWAIVPSSVANYMKIDERIDTREIAFEVPMRIGVCAFAKDKGKSKLISSFLECVKEVLQNRKEKDIILF